MVAAVLLVALVVAGACSDGRDSQPGATVPPGDDGSSTSAPATTLGAEAYAVPEVIDQAYVQRVVGAYDKVLGDAIRILKREGAVTEEFLEHLVAIYTEEEFEVHQRLWTETVANGRLERTPEDPGDPRTELLELVEVRPGCLVVRVDRDFGPTLTSGADADTPEDDYLVLVPRPPGLDPRDVNPTPWIMSFDGFKNDNSVPRNSCDG